MRVPASRQNKDEAMCESRHFFSCRTSYNISVVDGEKAKTSHYALLKQSPIRIWFYESVAVFLMRCSCFVHDKQIMKTENLVWGYGRK